MPHKDRSATTPAMTTAIVTGASGAIGSSIVRHLLTNGWSVIGVDLQPSPLDSAEENALTSICGDAADPEVVAEAVRLARSGPPLGAVVSTVGMPATGALTDVTLDEWDHAIAICLRSAAICAQLTIPELVDAGGGSITFVSSIHARIAAPRRAAYATAKAGILGLSRQLAVDYGPLGVRSNVVSPGLIQRAAGTIPESRAAFLTSATPMRRLGRPDDVGAAAAYLASPNASFVNGIELTVDGGASVTMSFSLDPGPASWSTPPMTSRVQ